MKKVRQSIFETNSSSMHSFVIAKNPKIEVHKEDFEPYIKDGVLTIKGEYYTYGPEQITNQYEKACYVLANRYDEGLKEHLEQVDKLKALLKEKLGVKEVIVDIENACVEHNSVGLVMHVVQLKNLSLVMAFYILTVIWIIAIIKKITKKL